MRPAIHDLSHERPRARGRPPGVDRDAIAEAVLDIGFPDVTFAAVAQRLGVAQATLYRHAPNREELSRIALDLALRRHPWPPLKGPWAAVLEAWALASWHFWEEHPGMVGEAMNGAVPPALAALADEIGAFLLRAGFTASAAVMAVDIVFDLAADSRRGAESLDGQTGGVPVRQEMDRLWGAAPDESIAGAGSTRRERAAIRGAMLEAIRDEPLAWFRGKLGIVMAGIECELAPRRREEGR